MMPIRVAVATRCLNQPLKQSIEWAAKTGAGGVQLDARREIRPIDLSQTGRRELRRLLDELGLRVASLCFLAQRTLYDRERMDQRIGAVKAAMTLASQLKTTTLTVRVGRIPNDENASESQLLGPVLNDLARHGNHVGVTLAVTPVGDSPETLAHVLDAVREGPLGIDFDPASFVSGGHDVIAAMRRLHSAIVHVRFRDAVRDVDGSALEVPVGRGDVPWDEFVAVLDEIAFRGWLTADRTQGADQPGDVARAVEYLQRLVTP